ncbi:hypothetical protein FGIG_10085 [Fasciola gigantica]|uniref:Uncharacterized protein n=1 Tax=Fasciola gigantica TaxID=46835 RepID=A0A504Z652_FASGI|nr:hypothetical protein FGIG_10085 [Fasciola gigantica]
MILLRSRPVRLDMMNSHGLVLHHTLCMCSLR